MKNYVFTTYQNKYWKQKKTIGVQLKAKCDLNKQLNFVRIAERGPFVGFLTKAPKVDFIIRPVYSWVGFLARFVG